MISIAHFSAEKHLNSGEYILYIEMSKIIAERWAYSLERFGKAPKSQAGLSGARGDSWPRPSWNGESLNCLAGERD